MKLAAIATIAAASLALVSADAPCDAKLTTALTAASTNQAKCKTESGYDISAAAPTAAVLTKFCASTTCVSLWKSLKGLGLSECMIYEKHLNKEILNPIAAACPALAATTPAPISKAPATNATTPATTTKAPSTSTTPAATTKAPAVTTKAPTAASATASNSTAAKTPSTATTPAPTTKAPTSGASAAISMTAGTVVLAVATAAFF